MEIWDLEARRQNLRALAKAEAENPVTCKSFRGNDLDAVEKEAGEFQASLGERFINIYWIHGPLRTHYHCVVWYRKETG
jgi:hypothetical protein